MPCGREIRLRRVKSLRRWGIYFISLDAKHQISQFAEQIISPWAKRTISLFVWTKRFEYWARSVSRLGAPRCLRQMKRCFEQEETTSIAKRSKRARRLCFWPKGSLVRVQHGAKIKNPVERRDFCFVLFNIYHSLNAHDSNEMHLSDIFEKFVLNKAQLNILMIRMCCLLGYVCL